MPIQLTVNSRGYIKGANFPLQVNLPDDATLSMLKNGVAHLVPQLTLERQRITDAEKKPLVGDDKRLTDLNVKSGDALQVKDLGPQISWRTVFLVEYVRLYTHTVRAAVHPPGRLPAGSRGVGLLWPPLPDVERARVRVKALTQNHARPCADSLYQARARDDLRAPFLQRNHAHVQHL